MHIAVFVDDSTTPAAIATGMASAHQESTLVIAAVVNVEKSRQLQLKMAANRSSSVSILPGSTFSIFLVGRLSTPSSWLLFLLLSHGIQMNCSHDTIICKHAFCSL